MSAFGQLSPIPHNLNQHAEPERISQKIPVYKINQPYFHKGDYIVPKGSYLKLWDEPDTSMEPVNELAEVEMRKHLAKLDNLGAKKAEKEGRDYRSLLEQYDKQKMLKDFIDDSEDMEEGVIARPGEEKLNILGAKKYVTDDEDITTDPAQIKKKAMQERMKKARETMLKNRATKKSADLA